MHLLGELKWLQEIPHFASHKECGEGLDNPRKVHHEVLVEVGKADEDLNILVGSWYGPIVDAAHMVQLHGDASWYDDVADEPNPLHPELALLQVEIQPSLAEVLKHLAHMPLMIHLILGEDQDVVQVHQADDIKAVFQDTVDILLECCGGVDKFEWYDVVLKVTIPSSESCLPLVTLLDPDQVVCGVDVKLHVHLSTHQPVEHLVDQRQGVSVLPSQLVETAVVDACHGSGPVAHLAQVTHLAGKFHLHCFLVCYGNCRCLMTQHLSGCL